MIITFSFSALLGTIPEIGGEDLDNLQPPGVQLPPPPQPPAHRSATVGRVTFEEGVVTGPPPPRRRASSPSPSVVAAVAAAAAALVAERSATIGPIVHVDEGRSPSPSGKLARSVGGST